LLNYLPLFPSWRASRRGDAISLFVAILQILFAAASIYAINIPRIKATHGAHRTAKAGNLNYYQSNTLTSLFFHDKRGNANKALNQQCLADTDPSNDQSAHGLDDI
jgi:hypothetical protein